MISHYSKKKLYVYSFRKSGTNLFASYMNLHPSIFSINTGGGKITNIPKNLEKRSIFARGVNYPKNKIEYVLFDEIHPQNYDKNNKGIVLIRDLEKIHNSVRNLEKKTGWVFNVVTKQEYKLLNDLSDEPNIKTVKIYDFVNNHKKVLDEVCKWLNLPVIKDYDPDECICGSKFTYIETDEIFGEYWKHDKPQKYKFCPNHNHVLTAFGGTNPIQKLDIERQK